MLSQLKHLQLKPFLSQNRRRLGLDFSKRGMTLFQKPQRKVENIVQEAHWELPYFDATTFSEDLERVAAQMRSLLQTAFEHEFAPNCKVTSRQSPRKAYLREGRKK